MKNRTITGIIVAAIVLPLLIMGGWAFKIFVLIVAGAGMKELLDAKGKMPVVIETLTYIYYYLIILFNVNATTLIFNPMMMILSFIIFLVPMLFYVGDKKYTVNDAFYLMGCTLFLSTAFSLIIIMRNVDLYLLLFLIIIPVVTDAFAYFSGVLFGKHKMAPLISPHKTWEGSIGGSLFGVVISTLFYMFIVDNGISVYIIILITLLLSILGQIGDLVFSAIKRNYKIKDYSNLMPGHGGILDRLDSIIFVLLAYALYFTL